MFRKVLRSKIHRATVTAADLDYEGSITLPPHLMDTAGIVEYEAVCVWNVTNGSRLETYAIKGEDDSSDICMNGAAAHLTHAGDLVIIACYQFLESDAVSAHKPTLVFVDEKNQIKDIRDEVAGPLKSCA